MKPLSTTLKLTMWDWSWLSHRVPGGAFEDWHAVLRATRERGFNTVRFDPLPDLVARSGEPREVTFLPHEAAVPWIRVPAAQTIDPVEESVALARAAVDEGLRVILSSWGLGRGREADGTSVQFGRYPDFRRAEDDDAEIGDYLRGWGEVLEAFRSAGLLQHVAYVDLNNELDMVIPLVSGRFPDVDLTVAFDWTPEMGDAFRSVAERLVRWCHERFPEVAATTSCCGPLDVVAPWFPRNADIAEWHVWYMGGRAWEDRAQALLGQTTVDGTGLADPEARRSASQAYETIHDAAGGHLRRKQDRYLERIWSWAQERALPLVLGEGYAVPWYSDLSDMSWRWIREVSEGAVGTVRRLGYDGYTTSNFSEPTFPLWEDIAWHRDLLGADG